MTKQEKAILVAALRSGHLTMQCPGELGAGPCDGCRVADQALEILRALDASPKAPRKAKP